MSSRTRTSSGAAVRTARQVPAAAAPPTAVAAARAPARNTARNVRAPVHEDQDDARTLANFDAALPAEQVYEDDVAAQDERSGPPQRGVVSDERKAPLPLAASSVLNRQAYQPSAAQQARRSYQPRKTVAPRGGRKYEPVQRQQANGAKNRPPSMPELMAVGVKFNAPETPKFAPGARWMCMRNFGTPGLFRLPALPLACTARSFQNDRVNLLLQVAGNDPRQVAVREAFEALDKYAVETILFPNAAILWPNDPPTTIAETWRRFTPTVREKVRIDKATGRPNGTYPKCIQVALKPLKQTHRAYGDPEHSQFRGLFEGGMHQPLLAMDNGENIPLSLTNMSQYLVGGKKIIVVGEIMYITVVSTTDKASIGLATAQIKFTDDEGQVVLNLDESDDEGDEDDHEDDEENEDGDVDGGADDDQVYDDDAVEDAASDVDGGDVARM